MATPLPAHQTVAGVLSEGKTEEKQPPVYTSSTFFTWSEVFPTAHDFFRTAHQRLKTDCGHAARPSKQKPTKITARCEKQEKGCPFRLCAFLDAERGKWHVSTRLCVWDHSHPPRNESATLSPPSEVPELLVSTVAPVSDPARTVVLFADGTRFSTPSSFFAQARARALELYGWAMYKNSGSGSSLLSVCAAGPVKQFSCRYRLRAKRDGLKWVVDNANSILIHSHAQRPSDQVTALAAPTARARPSVKPLAPAESTVPITVSPSKPVKEVPGAPRSNYRFSTVDEAYVAFAVANILHLGVSVFRSHGNALAGMVYCNRRSDVACPFRAVLGPDETESYTVVLPVSVLSHNHGPRSQVLEDPTWRPLIRCPLVLAALNGTAPIAVQTTTKRPFSPVEVSAPAKRGRTDTLFQPTSKAPAPVASTAHASYPTPPLSAQTPSTTHVPLHGPDHDTAAGVPLEDRISLVEAFLFGVEPAIAPLAQRLVAAGIDSLEALVELATLSPAIRKVLLEDLDREVAADGQPGLPSAICLVPSFPS